MQKLLDSTRRLQRVLRWSAKLLWETDRPNCLLLAAASLVIAALAPLSVVLMAWIVNLVKSGLTDGTLATMEVWTWIPLVGALAIAGMAAVEVRKYCNTRLTERVGLRARRVVLAHTVQLDLASIEQSEVQNEIASVALEPGGVIVKSITGLIDLVCAFVQLVGLAGIMLFIEPLWTLGFLAASLPIMAAGGLLSLARHRLRLKHAETRRWSRYYGRHLTNHKLVPSVQVLGLADLLIGRDSERHVELHLARRKIDRIELGVKVTTMTFAISIMLMAIHSVIVHAVQGTIEFYNFLAFWGAAWRLAKDSPKVATSFSAASKAWLAIDHFHRFLNLRQPKESRSRQFSDSPQGEIVINQISFRYPKSHRDALCDVSLRIAPGETIAIVGHNGAGKTTLAKLIAGLYRPTAGEILYDGISHSLIDFQRFHRRMAFVFQQPLQFEATARENIALGDWDRLAEAPEEVERLAAELGVAEMISDLPEGFETRLGRMFGQHDLSGGQWQKLAIARALACDPAIVLLDEPTAGLDVYAEAELHRCMQRLVRDRTAIIISHRFSTVMDADRILVLDQGKLAEQGTHLELLAKSGIYSAMWHVQRQQAA